MLGVYTLERSDEWDEIVRSFKEYDVYWLSGYVRAFYIHGDGEPLLFYYENEVTRGINVVLKRDISDDRNFKNKLSGNRFFDFSTPYGYGGWIVEGDENIEDLSEEYISAVNHMGVISEFVRFHPMVENHSVVKELYDVVELGSVVHMPLDTPGLIWNNMTSKNRNVIRKAIKNDVKIYNGRHPRIYDVFKDIYDQTMDRDDAEDYYYFDIDFYKSIIEDIPYSAQVFWAEKDKKVIAASIILMANGKMNYHLSGSLKEYSTYAPSNLILYEAALWGYMNGYRTLYLGGGVGSEEDSLFKFKRAFYKGDLRHFYIGKRIYDKDTYEELVDMRGGIENQYFPLYRAC